MPLLLTILSVIALWALLTTLVLGLLFVLKALQSVRGHLRRITAGVRAIEQETAPLGDRVAELPPAAAELDAALRRLATRVEETDRRFASAAPALTAEQRR